MHQQFVRAEIEGMIVTNEVRSCGCLHIAGFSHLKDLSSKPWLNLPNLHLSLLQKYLK